jgi:UDP-glucose 4-epimerase
MRILITGGNGGIGRDLVPALLQRGHEVVVLDREVGALVPHPRLRVVRGLVEEAATVAEACRGADAIVHLAWSFSDDPGYLLEHDLRGHVYLQEAGRREGVGRLLYTSTAVVYGKPVRHPLTKTTPF